MTRILVTGVRGKTGAPLAELLLARPDVEVLGGSSDAGTVTAAGVRPTAFSWDDPAGWAAATDGVDGVYVVRPDRPDAPELVAALLARTALSTRVVLLSERDPEPVGPEGWAVRVEREVHRSARPWTVLRPGWFMQVLTDPRFFLGAVTGDGSLEFPAGGARLAWVDARDIAAVAERVLLEGVGGGHDGRTYEITGPQALSLPETAALLATATGRPVTHREVSIEEGLVGMDGFERELTELTYERVRDGIFAGVTDTVEQVTGRPARSLADFLADAAATLGRTD